MNRGDFLKKAIFLLLMILIAAISLYFAVTYPRSFSSVSDLNSEAKSITLVNTTHKSPSVEIKNEADIANILKRLSNHKYKRTYFLYKPIGSQFAFYIQGIKSNEKVEVIFYGSENLLRINGQFYYCDMELTNEILSYLTKKSYAQKADIYFAKVVEEVITKVSRRYGEPNPAERLEEDKTERDFKQMYLVNLKGNFKKGNLSATNLSFSMLADGSKIWAIRAMDNNHIVWEENE